MSDDDKPDLTAVLEHYQVRLRGRQKQMVSCPLHTDATPSCSIDLDKGLWNCKSCGERGDSYTMLMKMEEIDFVRARALAATLGLSTGVAGGSDGDVPSCAYGGGRKVAGRKGDRPSGSKYVPSWRRRD